VVSVSAEGLRSVVALLAYRNLKVWSSMALSCIWDGLCVDVRISES
jgi:hypothetical protein